MRENGKPMPFEMTVGLLVTDPERYVADHLRRETGVIVDILQADLTDTRGLAQV